MAEVPGINVSSSELIRFSWNWVPNEPNDIIIGLDSCFQELKLILIPWHPLR